MYCDMAKQPYFSTKITIKTFVENGVLNHQDLDLSTNVSTVIQVKVLFKV